MSCKDPAYVPLVADLWVNSKSDGTARTWVITPPTKWALGLGLNSFLVGLRVTTPDTYFGIKVKWQHSIDSCCWKTRSTELIAQQTAADDYTGALLRSAAPADFPPYVRVVVEVEKTAGSAEVGAFISVWGYYQYGC